MKTIPLIRMLPTMSVALIVGFTTACERETRPTVTTAPGAAITSSAPQAVTVGTDSTAAVSTAVNPLPDKPLRMPVPPQNLSPQVQEVARMAQAGVELPVLQAYVETSAEPYNVSVEEILYLQDLGVPNDVVATLVRRRDSIPALAAPTSAPAVTSVGQSTPAQAGVAAPVEQPVPVDAAPRIGETPPAQDLATTPVEGAQGPTVGVAPPAEAPPAGPPPQVVNNYFYESLAPYGSWVQVNDYGWCWRPSVSVYHTGWRPYWDRGRWLDTDAGWYWQSDYSWGYIPFHYGRWHRSGSWGWVWVPGTTWGPAWVTWRHGGGYAGWAPLPPACGYVTGVGLTWHGSRVSVGFGFGLSVDHFGFVPIGSFAHSSPWMYGVPHHRARGVYHNTTVINNYINGDNNNVVINAGIASSVIAGSSRTPIPRATLREVDSPTRPGSAPDRLDPESRTLAVYRPKVPTPAPAPPASITRSQSEPRTATTIPSRSPAGRLGNPAIAPSRPSGDRPSTSSPAGTSSIPSRSPRPVGGAGSSLSTVPSNSRDPGSASSTIPSRSSSAGVPDRSDPPAATPQPISRPVPFAPLRPRPEAVQPPASSIPSRTVPSRSAPTVATPSPAPPARGPVSNPAAVAVPSRPAAPLNVPGAVNRPEIRREPAISSPAPSLRSLNTTPVPSRAPEPSVNRQVPSYQSPARSGYQPPPASGASPGAAQGLRPYTPVQRPSPGFSQPGAQSFPVPSRQQAIPPSQPSFAPRPAPSLPSAPRSVPQPSISAPAPRSVAPAPAPAPPPSGGGSGSQSVPSRRRGD